MNKKKLGDIGEKYACDYLCSKGYEIDSRNVQVGRFEIDIIARIKKKLVFIEVKTRSSDRYVDLLDSIGKEKESSLIESCEEFLNINNLHETEYRIDLIGILVRNNVVKKLKHLKGIV